jgi:hypothetical protein
LGALVTTGLGAVANHFISGTTSDQEPQKPVQNPQNSAWNGHQANWWSGADSSSENASTENPVLPAHSQNTAGTSNVSTNPTTPPTSNTTPVPHFSSGSVILRDSLVPIGSNAAPIYAFAGPLWMKTAPLTNATRPSPNQTGSGKSSKKNQSVWESPIQVNLNAGTTTNKNSKNSNGASSNGTGTSTASGHGIPVNHGYQLAGGELFLNGNQTPGSTKSSEPTYALLGLATGSTPQSSTTDTVSGELHFSLAGQVSTVPTLGITDGTPVTNGIPEPTTGVMMAAGVAMLISRRRRLTA